MVKLKLLRREAVVALAGRDVHRAVDMVDTLADISGEHNLAAGRRLFDLGLPGHVRRDLEQGQ